jgi:hypothetical protein
MGKQVLLKSLMVKKEQLVYAKNECTNKMFYFLRKGLQKRVKELDVELDKVNNEIRSIKTSLNFTRPTLIKGFKK